MRGIDRPTLLTDAALGLATTAVVTVAIVADVGERRHDGATAYLIAVGLGAVLLLRRRYPVLVLVATICGLFGYYLLNYPPIGLALPAAAALYSAAETGRTGWAVGAASVLLGVSTTVRLVQGADAAHLLGFELAGSVAMMAAAVALGDGVCSRRLLRAEQRERLRQERASHDRDLVEAVQAERLQIARDVHDVVGHTLTIVSLHTDVALEAIEQDPGATRRALEHVRTACGTASRELRRTLGMIRATATPGIAALTTLAEGIGPDVSVQVAADVASLPPVVEAAIFRIAQEAVTNARRHAGAAPIAVRVRTAGPDVEIEVTDDGDHPVPSSLAPGGHGLIGLRERVALLGGCCETGPRPGGGYRVWATLPREVRT